MKRKWRRIKKDLLTALLDVSPIFLRDAVLRSQVRLDYSPPPNLKFKLAESKEELEQAYRLLYKSYVASGSMRPNGTGLRITPYHTLPSTSMLIATVDEKVVATVSIFRISPFGLPVSKVYDVSRFTNNGLRIAEISSLCVDDDYKSGHRTLLFGLLKYLYEYATKYFGIDVKLIVIKPFRRHFYESMLCFEKLEDRLIENYGFSNGATVMAEFINLNTAPERFKAVYNNYPDEQNLYKYFVESKISNFHFPDRPYHLISDPVLTPELFHYFFVEKTETLKSMTPFELAVLKNIYRDPEYQKIISEISKGDLPTLQRAEERFELKSNAVLLGRNGTLDQIVQVHDVSRGGILLFCQGSDKPAGVAQLRVTIGPKTFSYLDVELKWTNGLGYCGYKVVRCDAAWDEFIEHAYNQAKHIKVG